MNYHPNKVTNKQCNPESLSQDFIQKPSFTTTVRVLPAITSTGVDSDRWLHQHKQEEMKKVQEKDQPQGFWSKYWMYIVIGFVVMAAQGGG